MSGGELRGTLTRRCFSNNHHIRSSRSSRTPGLVPERLSHGARVTRRRSTRTVERAPPTTSWTPLASDAGPASVGPRGPWTIVWRESARRAYAHFGRGTRGGDFFMKRNPSRNSAQSTEPFFFSCYAHTHDCASRAPRLMRRGDPRPPAGESEPSDVRGPRLRSESERKSEKCEARPGRTRRGDGARRAPPTGTR